MDTQLNRQCNEALHARSLPDLLSTMVDFSQARGFGRVSATVLTKHSPTLCEYQFIASVPVDYVPEFENMEAARCDPVSQHVAIHSASMVWNQSTYVGCGQGALWERQAPYGYRSGIVMGFHLPRGRSSLFGPDSDSAICASPARVREIVEDFQPFASHARAAALELCPAYDPPLHELPTPTHGELEALRWTMDGMKDWDIGAKLGLSERDVTLRLQRAMRKLECGARYEAVLKAIKLCLIEGM